MSIESMAEGNTLANEVARLMERLDKDQELQDLAERNGIEVKNTVRLTPETKDNIAVTIVALKLAKQANDPKYTQLSRMGLSKRKLKTELVNDYKDQAIQLIKATKWLNQNSD